MNTQTTQTSEASYHYKLVRRAIDRLDQAQAPVSLEDLAAEMQLSPTYLQRLFSKWAGVSPKRYQQFLALDHAKSLLKAHHTTLDTALETGLSGGGRLHDLFLRWEAMSPGDYAKGAEALTIATGCFDSPFGEVLAMGTRHGLCGLAFTEETGRETAYADLAARWPHAKFKEDAAALAPWVEAAFGFGAGQTRLHMIGAPFQIKVWEALLHVPSGHVTTYSDIARAVGSPKAVRAVGTAVGRNPVSWLIPCHRALRKSGELGGYHWGLPVKRAMLAYEIGAATGVVAGLISGDTAEERRQNALKGAAIGAAGGAAIGNVLDRQAADLRQSLGNDRVTITNTGDRLIVTLPQDILFATDSAALRPDLQSDLVAVANNLQNYPDSTVQVIGHTDNTGDAAYNQNLSVQRAGSVTNVLAGAGVAASRLQPIGRGEDQPIASNLTEEGKAQNRRVEIVILPTA